MTSAAAIRYARALAHIVMAPGSGIAPGDALAQLRDFDTAVEGSDELKNVLLSPAVGAARKRAVIAKLAALMGIGEKVRNFLYVVVDHRRANLLHSMTEAFELAIDEKLGRIRADVRTARELTSEQKSSIAAELERLAGAEVRCEFGVDGELLGGVSARVGSTVYDGTVSGRLESLRRRLVSK